MDPEVSGGSSDKLSQRERRRMLKMAAGEAPQAPKAGPKDATGGPSGGAVPASTDGSGQQRPPENGAKDNAPGSLAASSSSARARRHRKRTAAAGAPNFDPSEGAGSEPGAPKDGGDPDANVVAQVEAPKSRTSAAARRRPRQHSSGKRPDVPKGSASGIGTAEAFTTDPSLPEPKQGALGVQPPEEGVRNLGFQASSGDEEETDDDDSEDRGHHHRQGQGQYGQAGGASGQLRRHHLAVPPPPISPSPYLLQPQYAVMASEPVDRVYLENVTGFSKASKKKVFAIDTVSCSNQVEPQSVAKQLMMMMIPLDLGLSGQKVFRGIGVFSHGFLAGLAFWHLVMVHIFCDSGLMTLSEFLALYSPLSQPLHLLFYLLTTLCVVSILDRYDVAQFDWRQVQMMLTFRSCGISIVLYLVTLVLTLVTTRIDDKLSLYQHNSTTFDKMNQEELESEIYLWKVLNLCRSIGVVLGWVLISIRPSTDLLYKNLKKLSKYKADKIMIY